jgi:hypothetical protein
MPDPTPQQILDTPMPGDNDAGASTVRGYLVALAGAVWTEGECFSGKRPFGNSGWSWDLYAALAEAGHLEVVTDEYGEVDIDDANRDAGNRMVESAIRALAGPAPAPAEPTTEQAEADRIIRSAVEDIEFLTIAETAPADADIDRIDDLIRSATVTVTWAQADTPKAEGPIPAHFTADYDDGDSEPIQLPGEAYERTDTPDGAR